MKQITRGQLIKELSKESDYYQKDVGVLLMALDRVIFNYFTNVAKDEDIEIQLLQGLKIGCKKVPERQRRDPNTQEEIICPEGLRPFAKYSDWFKNKIQEKD